jgi:hypothetical protein
MSILALREARRHVYSFADESEIMRNHREAMECMDCEAVLQLGIDAYHWMILADETLRRCTYRGDRCEAEMFQLLERLFREWLKPCSIANEWIAIHKSRGYDLANLEEFRKCEREVVAIVGSFDGDAMTDPLREVRDSAVMEHRNGETAEFV